MIKCGKCGNKEVVGFVEVGHSGIDIGLAKKVVTMWEYRCKECFGLK